MGFRCLLGHRWRYIEEGKKNYRICERCGLVQVAVKRNGKRVWEDLKEINECR